MVRVVFVRHSETYFNVEKKANKAKFPNKHERNAYLQTLRNFDFVDSDLTPQGIEVTRQAVKDNQAALAKIKWVVVSPMIRTLHTAEVLFQPTPGQPAPKAIVHPYLKTKLTRKYNLPFKYLTQRERFSGLDWSLMDQKLKDFGWAWFTQELVTDQHRQALGKIATDGAHLPLEEQVTGILDYMEKIYPASAETQKEKFFQLADFLVWLSEFIQKHGIKDDELCVVSHSSPLKMLVADNYNEEFVPAKTPKMGNTEFVSKDIRDTFLFKFSQSPEGKKQLADLRLQLATAWAKEGSLKSSLETSGGK